MKKSVVTRTLQLAAAVAAYSMISIWASTTNVNFISSILTNLDSILVILAISFGLPYLCFKALGKLYTPPIARSIDNNTPISQAQVDEIAEDLETMQYRGTRYNQENLPNSTTDTQSSNDSKPVIKYRGAEIADTSAQTVKDSFSTDRQSQKSAIPKERMKYRGSYVD